MTSKTSPRVTFIKFSAQLEQHFSLQQTPPRLGFKEKRSFGIAVVYRLNASRIIGHLRISFSENYDANPVNKSYISLPFGLCTDIKVKSFEDRKVDSNNPWSSTSANRALVPTLLCDWLTRFHRSRPRLLPLARTGQLWPDSPPLHSTPANRLNVMCPCVGSHYPGHRNPVRPAGPLKKTGKSSSDTLLELENLHQRRFFSLDRQTISTVDPLNLVE